VWLLVDAGRLLRARIGAQTMLDRTVTAALTLAQVALASGDRVGLLAYGRRLQQRIAPARGAAHLRLVDAPRCTPRRWGRSGAAAARSWWPSGALVVWLTDVADTAAFPT
jgi:uncharacterized protein (DUF58 family)